MSLKKSKKTDFYSLKFHLYQFKIKNPDKYIKKAEFYSFQIKISNDLRFSFNFFTFLNH